MDYSPVETLLPPRLGMNHFNYALPVYKTLQGVVGFAFTSLKILLNVCCGWTFPGFSEGFICGGEMLSFGILSSALMVMVIIGIQFIQVFLLG